MTTFDEITVVETASGESSPIVLTPGTTPPNETTPTEIPLREEIIGFLTDQDHDIVFGSTDKIIAETICVVCEEPPTTKGLVSIPCGHLFCDICLEDLFSSVLKGDPPYPPRCCRSIPFEVARPYLSQKLAKEFRAKRLELSTKNPIHCHDPKCATFIAPQSIHNSMAICQKCLLQTCAYCKQNWHFGPCSQAGDEALEGLAWKEHWKRCPGCRAIVERVEGCPHISCRCGTAFCYACGAKAKACKCKSGAYDEYMTDLWVRHSNEGHQHTRTVRQQGARFQCDVCRRTFTHWISECTECQLRLCKECVRNPDRVPAVWVL